ncbi:MAG: IS1595 family transposase, partial [Candidatus Dojkabacteria bacterium]|nr:IS1595 family transposase [Candidatus Dojkabacteria bacterium]
SGSDIYTDGWKSYHALAVYGYNHKKVIHEKNEFSDKKDTHINGVESFWSYAKRRMNKFNGIKKDFFKRYLLESEWRFNHRRTIMRDLEKMLRKF